jgi:hypothetical protein
MFDEDRVARSRSTQSARLERASGMGREGFEPSTLGLRVTYLSLGGSREGWESANLWRLAAMGSRFISAGLAAPAWPHSQDLPLASFLGQLVLDELLDRHLRLFG